MPLLGPLPHGQQHSAVRRAADARPGGILDKVTEGVERGIEFVASEGVPVRPCRATRVP